MRSRTPLQDGSARPRRLYLTTNNTHKRHFHLPGGIRSRYCDKQAAADSRLRLRGHWNRLYCCWRNQI